MNHTRAQRRNPESDFHPWAGPGLERHPSKQEQGVVVGRIAAKSIIVLAATIEFRIGDILHAKLQVGPRRHPGARLTKRYPVCLDNEGIAIRLSVGTVGYFRAGGVKHLVRRSPGVLPA